MAELGSKAPRILLVDDRPENLLALEAILHGFGYDLAKANSGEEALKLLLTDDFALILLDVQMPGMDGFETATHIKQRERTREIPILFLTAIDSEAHQAYRGYAAGAVDYLSKPFDPWVLRAKVGVFIELFERRRQLGAQVDELRARLDMHTSGAIAELAESAGIALEEARALSAGGQPAGPAIARATEAVSSLRTVLGAVVDGVPS
jgi:CheY-like chemotaxis protein